MGAWTDSIPQELTYEGDGGAKLPLREHPFVKESPDMGHFVNRAFTQHRELGARIPIKVDKTKPDEVTKWRTDYLPKLYDAGVLDRPLTKIEDYEIKAPTDVPQGVTWNEDRAKKLAELGLKYGISKQALHDIIELRKEDALASVPELQTDYDNAIAALKKEYGADYDARLEQTKRLNAVIFKDPKELEFVNATGLGNHPIWLGILMRLAPLAAQDSSFGLDVSKPGSENAGGGVSDALKAKAELTDIQTNKENPKYSAFWRNDATVNAYIQELYKKAYPGQVTL